MRYQSSPTNRGQIQRGPRRDRGSSFIELLVSIVLLGLAVVGVLTTLRVTVIGTTTERDHARAQQWLQSSIGVLDAADRVDCDVGLGEETVRLTYQATLRAATGLTPPGWKGDPQLTVVKPVKVWDGTKYWDPYDPTAPATCFDNDGFELQLITIEVTSPSGSVIERVEVVKDGS